VSAARRQSADERAPCVLHATTSGTREASAGDSHPPPGDATVPNARAVRGADYRIATTTSASTGDTDSTELADQQERPLVGRGRLFCHILDAEELLRPSRVPDEGAGLLSRRVTLHCRAGDAPELRGTRGGGLAAGQPAIELGHSVQAGRGRDHRCGPRVDRLNDLRGVDPLQIDRRDPEVGVSELALDHDQRYALVRHLDSVGMT